MVYKHLNYLQRCQILAFWTQRSIAKEIGVHESTISRELKRNITFVRTRLGTWQYKPDYAQNNANQRHKNKNKFIKFTDYAKSWCVTIIGTKRYSKLNSPLPSIL